MTSEEPCKRSRTLAWDSERAQFALTNNSSLIQHLRDNKLLADTVLGAEGAILTAASLVVGPQLAMTARSLTAFRAPCTAP